MPLKNESIRAIRDYLPEVMLGPEILNTHKGTIAHVPPPKESIARSERNREGRLDSISPDGFLVLRSDWSLFPMRKLFSFWPVIRSIMRYLGEKSFQAAAGLIKSCRCYKLTYSDFDSAIDAMNALTDDI